MATVSRVLNNSALVSPDTRDVVMKAVTQTGLPAQRQRPGAGHPGQRYHRRGGDGRLRRLLRRVVKAVDTVAQQHQKYVLIGNSHHEAEKNVTPSRC
ncbi:LacI family DNA-binding transcriptional regulator [Klebsiella pneumoniae subsp. pneumoniae]|nr:LacI family DNA-binding transcriptional regulator [Klebsiella pneumoniae subsp. pneumoniae]